MAADRGGRMTTSPSDPVADSIAAERAAVVAYLKNAKTGNANVRAAWDDLIRDIERGYHVTGKPLPF